MDEVAKQSIALAMHLGKVIRQEQDEGRMNEVQCTIPAVELLVQSRPHACELHPDATSQASDRSGTRHPMLDIHQRARLAAQDLPPESGEKNSQVILQEGEAAMPAKRPRMLTTEEMADYQRYQADVQESLTKNTTGTGPVPEALPDDLD